MRKVVLLAMLGFVLASFCGCTSAQVWGDDKYFRPVDPVGGFDHQSKIT